MVTVSNPYIVLKCQALFEALEIHELTWSHHRVGRIITPIDRWGKLNTKRLCNKPQTT